jgi:hypothetical protein
VVEDRRVDARAPQVDAPEIGERPCEPVREDAGTRGARRRLAGGRAVADAIRLRGGRERSDEVADRQADRETEALRRADYTQRRPVSSAAS